MADLGFMEFICCLLLKGSLFLQKIKLFRNQQGNFNNLKDFGRCSQCLDFYSVEQWDFIGCHHYQSWVHVVDPVTHKLYDFKNNSFHLQIHKFINQYVLNENCLLKLVFQTMPIPNLKCSISVRYNLEFSFTSYQIHFSFFFSLPEWFHYEKVLNNFLLWISKII